MRIRTIIVTGGAGFIGSNFIFYMKRKHPDYRLICLDKLTYAGNLVTLQPLMEEANFRFYKADICDRDAVYKVFEEEHPDVVVNFAAESHVDRSIESPETFLDTNIKGTAVIMDLTGQGIDVFSDCQNIVDNRNGFSRNRYINHMIRGIDTYDDM